MDRRHDAVDFGDAERFQFLGCLSGALARDDDFQCIPNESNDFVVQALDVWGNVDVARPVPSLRGEFPARAVVADLQSLGLELGLARFVGSLAAVGCKEVRPLLDVVEIAFLSRAGRMIEKPPDLSVTVANEPGEFLLSYEVGVVVHVRPDMSKPPMSGRWDNVRRFYLCGRTFEKIRSREIWSQCGGNPRGVGAAKEIP